MRNDFNYDIFISYHHQDEKKVRPIYEKMTSYGLRVFWSKKTLERGVEFPNELAEAVKESQHFALFWSHNTANSNWVSAECNLFFSQCHIMDKANRRMYVLLENPGDKDSLSGLLSDLNRPNSPAELVAEVVKTVLNNSADECSRVTTENKKIINNLQRQLDQERLKVEEARDYYQHNRFWSPIAENGPVHVFTCGRDVRDDPNSPRGSGGRTNIDMWDYRAVLNMSHFFASKYPNTKIKIEDPISKLQLKDFSSSSAGYLADHIAHMESMLENKDSIIVGSPDVNDFAEIVLAHIHHIAPYTDRREKSKGFVIIKEKKQTNSSFYWQKRESEKEGVAQITEKTRETGRKYFSNMKPGEDGSNGKMYGILIVAKNPFCKDGQQRRIIILSGFSGVATNAIAMLLTDERTYLKEFFRLDEKYVNLDRDIEALVGVEYCVDTDSDIRDTRQIKSITFEELVEI